MARERRARFAPRVRGVLHSFKDDGWADSQSRFDPVVTNQAVHEMHPKRCAVPLHRRALLDAGFTRVSERLRLGGMVLHAAA